MTIKVEGKATDIQSGVLNVLKSGITIECSAPMLKELKWERWDKSRYVEMGVTINTYIICTVLVYIHLLHINVGVYM